MTLNELIGYLNEYKEESDLKGEQKIVIKDDTIEIPITASCTQVFYEE